MYKILVIDEDTPHRERCLLDFRSEGYDVLGATSCLEGLEMVDLKSPDLVVLGRTGDEMDRSEAVLRLISRCPRIPVVEHSSPDRRGDRSLRQTADAWVPKSCDTVALRRQVRSFVAPDAV